MTTPAGTLPLYNVMLYVPSAELEPLPEGASCDSCASMVSGAPVASALSDERGRFVMDNVPAGSDVPLVVQVGKMARREVEGAERYGLCGQSRSIPSSRCLPKKQRARGISRALRTCRLTGALDALECLLLKIGIDEKEFTTPDEDGRK